MSFLSPLMLLGLLGAAIPVVVHLQGRRKAKVVPFAALDFLIATDKRLAKRLVLRQILQLIFRVLICLVLALVLARPYASCQSPGPTVIRGPQAVVIILDNSATAGYRLDGVTLLSRQVESALNLIEQLGPEAEIAVFHTTNVNHSELSRDHLGIRETLRNTELPFKKADTQTALQRGLQLLEASAHASKTIFLLSAATGANLPDSLMPPGEGVTLRHLDPAGDAELPNVGIGNLYVVADGSIGNRGVMVVAEVANYGSAPQKVAISLRVGSEIVARGELYLEPGARKEKRFSATLSEEQRTTDIGVELADDSLRADNTRFVVADARDQIPVLLVNGDSRTVRHEDELYYLEAALRPGDRSDSGTVITVTTPDALAEVELGDFDVVVLANIRELPRKQVARLSSWIQAGGGMMVAMGSEVDADRYNQQMAALLAQRLRSPLDLKHGRTKSSGQTLRLSKLEIDHPIFSVFTQDAPGLYNASFDQVMLLGPTTDVRDRKVLARYDNGAAALVEARKGAGLLLLFTSTLDRDWNNLAIHPGYLPLMQQITRYLSSKPFEGQKQENLVGDSVAIKVAPDDARIEVSGPGGSRHVLEGDKLAGRKSTRLDHIDIPGVYRIQSVDTDGQVQQRPASAFAANIDPSISDLRRVETRRLESQATIDDPANSAAQHTRRIELWHAIAAALILLLLVEAGLGLHGSRSRASNKS
jgi:hypothetical protein